MKTDFLQSCGHWWVFQICWRIEYSTLTASSFRIWNSSAGIPPPPLALFIVTLPKAYLTLHSKMCGLVNLLMCYSDCCFPLDSMCLCLLYSYWEKCIKVSIWVDCLHPTEFEVASSYGLDLYFLVTNDLGHCFMCLLTTCICSLEKYLFNSLSHFQLFFLQFCTDLPWFMMRLYPNKFTINWKCHKLKMCLMYLACWTS